LAAPTIMADEGRKMLERQYLSMLVMMVNECH
jgi:hypothetical protein